MGDAAGGCSRWPAIDRATDCSARRTGQATAGGGRAFNQRNGVVLPEAGYNPLKALLANNWTVLLDQMKRWSLAGCSAGGLIYLTCACAARARRSRIDRAGRPVPFAALLGSG